MATEISAADVTAVEEFLASLLSEQVPSGRYTDGTALRDLAVKALSVAAAQLRAENRDIRNGQSLLRLRRLAETTTDPDQSLFVADATDAVLSNWFVRRKSGGFSRGAVRVLVSRQQDYLIPARTPLYYDRQRIFYPDYDTDVIVNAADLRPQLNSAGVAIGYTFFLNVIASRTGDTYDVLPSVWAGAGNLSPFIVQISNSARFTGGKNRESTIELIDRSESAASARVLINPRSIDATLRDREPGLRRLLSTGMGDPEMLRDEMSEAATGLRMHVGGHFDIYLELPITTTTYEAQAGAAFVRPDGIICTFMDTNVADWTATGVAVGDVIRVTDGFQRVPRDFPIREVRAQELNISTAYPFPENTAAVTYYIYRPLFGPDVQIYPATGTSTTGNATSLTRTANRIVLPAEPKYDIIDVAIVNPDPGDPYITASDGLVHLEQRVNATPVVPDSVADLVPFQIISRSFRDAQSGVSFDELVVPAQYNNKRVRVTYETLAGFAGVDTYTRGRINRVICANVQCKAYHPVYLSFTLPYRQSPVSSLLVDPAAVRRDIVAYINSFDPRDVIDASDVTTYVRQRHPAIGTIQAFPIRYELLAPTGEVISFETEDVVTLDASKLTAPFSSLTNADLLDMGVTDRTVRYRTRHSRIQVEAF